MLLPRWKLVGVRQFVWQCKSPWLASERTPHFSVLRRGGLLTLVRLIACSRLQGWSFTLIHSSFQDTTSGP